MTLGARNESLGWNFEHLEIQLGFGPGDLCKNLSDSQWVEGMKKMPLFRFGSCAIPFPS